MISNSGKRAILIATFVLIVSLVFSRDYWLSTGHWWFGWSNYSLKINDLPQSDYTIYRAINGDVLVTCSDHMAEYYLSLKEQKAWEINRRKEVTSDGDFLLYFRHSLASDEVRNNRLKSIESPQFKLMATGVEFTDSLGQRITIPL